MAQASFGYMGIGKEVTHGTEVAPSKFLPVKDVNFPIENNFIEVREIRGSRQAYQTFAGPLRPNASFTSSFYPAGAMGYIFRGLFGASTDALVAPSATVFLHTFVDAASLPSYSFERSDARTDGAGAILHERLNGVKIESVSVTAEYGQDVEIAVNAQGLDFPTDPAAKPGSFTYPAMEPFIFSDVAVSIDGVSSSLFKTLNFEITNTLERQESLRGERTAYKIMEGGLDCTLSGNLIFEDADLYAKLQTGESFEVEVTFTGVEIDAVNALNYQAVFTWPKVRVATFDIPMTAGEIMEADVEFEVSYDVATDKLITVTLQNLDNATAYTA